MYEKRFRFNEPKVEDGYLDIPVILFTDPVLSEISVDAKVMFSMLFDILQRESYNNGWVDENGRIYVLTRPEDLKKSFKNSLARTEKVLDELEQKGMIERKKYKAGPDMIYVMDIFGYAEAKEDN